MNEYFDVRTNDHDSEGYVWTRTHNHVIRNAIVVAVLNVESWFVAGGRNVVHDDSCARFT
jgi:hypothetical protein